MPRHVHHDEHVLDSSIFLTDKIRSRTALVAVCHDCSGAAVDAEFVLQRHASQIVSLSRFAL